MNSLGLFLETRKKIISKLISILVFTLIVVYLYKNKEIFTSLKNIKISSILLIILYQIIIVCINAYLNLKIIHILEKKISLKECILLQYTNNFLNKVISKGGAIFRGYYLKNKLNLSYSSFVSTLAGLYIISFLCYSFLGILSQFLIYLKYGIYNIAIIAFFSGLFLVTIFLTLSNKGVKVRKFSRIGKIINNVIEGWNQIKQNKKTLIGIFFIVILVLLITTLQTMTIYKSIGNTIGFTEALYMSTISIITVFINITPDGIGIKEGIYMYSSQLINLDPDIILLGSLLGRVISLIPSIIIGGISYLILIKNLNLQNKSPNKLKAFLTP